MLWRVSAKKIILFAMFNIFLAVGGWCWGWFKGYVRRPFGVKVGKSMYCIIGWTCAPARLWVSKFQECVPALRLMDFRAPRCKVAGCSSRRLLTLFHFIYIFWVHFCSGRELEKHRKSAAANSSTTSKARLGTSNIYACGSLSENFEDSFYPNFLCCA